MVIKMACLGCLTCVSYVEGIKLEYKYKLPVWGVSFCVRTQEMWGKLEEEVDDAIPLTERDISIEPGDWVWNYSKEVFKKLHLDD